MLLYKEKFSAEETRDILRLFGAFWDITGRLIQKKQAPKTKIIKKTIDHLKKNSTTQKTNTIKVLIS